MTTPNLTTITLDNVKYVREDSIVQLQPNGNRKVLVIDRGWVIAGDVTVKDDNFILTRAVLVRNWSGTGTNGMLDKPLSDKVKLEPLNQTVEVPRGSVLFAVVVSENWGVK